MKVRAKTDIKHHPFYPLADDVITVPDDVGANWVANGWAVNEDTGEDNEPNLNPVTLDIQTSTLGVTSTEIGK